MSTPRWFPSATISAREQWLLKRLTRTKKLFAFLRLHRHELFDETYQAELAQMYRENGEGKEPVAPALLAMVVLLQAYTKASDAEAVELSLVDARWQMVLDVAGRDEPAFSQGALQAFRQRLIAHDMDRRLLERSVELAKQTGIFDWKKLPKDLRLAVDSRPIEGGSDSRQAPRCGRCEITKERSRAHGLRCTRVRPKRGVSSSSLPLTGATPRTQQFVRRSPTSEHENVAKFRWRGDHSLGFGADASGWLPVAPTDVAFGFGGDVLSVGFDAFGFGAEVPDVEVGGFGLEVGALFVFAVVVFVVVASVVVVVSVVVVAALAGFKCLPTP